MRVFIAGASGVLGRRLVQKFRARGHDVVGQVRSPRAETIVRAMGGEPRHADLFDADSLANAAEGCDTVIHAATAIPAKRHTVPADWAMNDRIRRQGTRRLTEAAGKIGARTYLQQSVVWVARPQDESSFDEHSPLGGDPLMQSAIDAETIAREAGTLDGFVTGVVRGGAFYDSDSSHTRMLAEALRKRLLPIVGGGQAVWAMIHTDDMAAAMVAIAEQPRNGAWHVVDNEPVTVRALLETFAARLGARSPRRLPVWMAKWIAGEQMVNYFARSTRTSNALLRQDFGWTPRYPSFREGLDQIVAAWKAEAPQHAETSVVRDETQR